jgi:hypothetical protein
MASFLSLSRMALAAMTLAVPFVGSGGCASRTACFAFTVPEFDMHMSCPSQSDALVDFTSPTCPGPIVSVDGPGSFDGELCCYPVTYDDINSDCGNSANGGAVVGAGGSAGTNTFPPVGPGPGAGPTSGPTSGPSSGTGTGTCPQTCAVALAAGGSLPPCSTNSIGVEAWGALLGACACATFEGDGGLGCESACVSFCQSLGIDPGCMSCLADKCPVQLAVCQSH